eukprot:5261819-Prymnesium_polylepis.1
MRGKLGNGLLGTQEGRCPIRTGRHVSPDPSVRHKQDTSKTHANRQRRDGGVLEPAHRAPRPGGEGGEHPATRSRASAETSPPFTRRLPRRPAPPLSPPAALRFAAHR